MNVLCRIAALMFFVHSIASPDTKSKDSGHFAKALDLLVKESRVASINDLIKEMSGVDDPKVAVLLPAAAVALPSAANYATTLDAIVAIKKDESIQALSALLKKAKVDYRQRVLILEAFGRRSDAPTLSAITEELKAPMVHVQVAAIRAARARKDKEPIAGLIEVLGQRWKARDRVWFEAHEALVGLSGKDFESIEDWKKFWEGAAEKFDPKEVGKENGSTRIDVKKPENSSVQFFGKEIFSRNIIFVIDVSGSMVMFDDSSKYKGSDIEQDRQRLSRAREQLTQALKKLPRAALFNIIAFSDRVLPWQTRMQPAAPQSVASALKFVNDFKAKGGTHTDEALEMAFADLSVDTIVLLSDGAPMYTFDDAKNPKRLIDKILGRVKDVNASRKVKIETFGFEGPGTWPKKVPWAAGGGLPPPPTAEECKTFVEFLSSLATESGGAFKALE